MLIVYLLLLAALQGVSELFPISSLGHSILVPALFHWPIDRDASWFLPYVVALHLGTAVALLLYFRRDWIELIGGVVKARGHVRDPQARLFWLLVVATIPAGLLGLLLEHRIRALFGGFTVAAVFLAVNGVLLIVGDRFRHRRAQHALANLGLPRAFLIGCAQALALIPGISRSGSTLVAGLMGGLDYAASARFSFLLATPIITAAGLLEIPKLIASGVSISNGLLWTFAGGAVLAGVAAWLSTWFLMRYFNTHEVTALRPFGIYCLLAGVMALVIHAV